jgi:hypothetical protein
MNREAIYSALFAKLSAIPGLKTNSRRLKHWSDVDKSAQPALLMAQTGESAQTTTGQPTRWTLRVDVYLYARTDGNKVPGQIINTLLDAVCDALKPSPVSGRQDLGVPGVEWCRIEGHIETDEGTLGDQLVAIVPIVILAS